MQVTCLSCGHAYEIPEGTDVRKLVCARCGTPQAANYIYERSVRFEAVGGEPYALAARLAREGRLDEAFAALEKAVAAGFSDVEAASNDPALARLRTDPRWAAVFRRPR